VINKGHNILNVRTLRLTALGAALLASAPAGAIGFGDIVLHSRVGEPLRAEVPINVEPGETLEGACFSLAPLNGSDLPVVSSAKTRLTREGDRYRLLITGSKPIGEPIFVVGLRASCGTDLQRDFVLMPSEPLVFANLPPAQVAAPAGAAANGGAAGGTRSRAAAIQEWRASEGETLEHIAEALISDNLAQQRRMLAALKRANPNLSGRPALAEGTPVMIPDLRQRVVAAERDLLPAQQAKAPKEPAAAPPPPPPPPKPKPRPAKPAAKAKPAGPDRVLLGAPPAEIKAGERPVPPSGSKAETDERMLKLEATIQLLNAQIEALDKAMALTAESLALQKKLQAAQAAEAGGLMAPVAKPAVPPPATGSSWPEILLAALFGGTVAAGLALFLSRRRGATVGAELPLAIAARSPGNEPARRPAPTAPVAPAVAVDAAHEGFSRLPGDVKALEVRFNEDESAIALAEIMLSFGRVQGAAEMLAQHIDEGSPDNPRPWLMLLDLYRRGGMADDYARVAPAVGKRFNLAVPAWETLGTPLSGLKSLEDFPHALEQATAMWGTQGCVDHLYRLVHDTRGGQRGGFPLEVVEEIVLLLLVLEDAYGLRRQAA
jgi:Tfp pilus assembly protein FimV